MTKFILTNGALAFLILSCGTVKNFVPAPKDTVPTRSKLESDVYGSYIRLYATDRKIYEGELIGTRNDTLVILSEQEETVLLKDVDSARVIVHMPNDYRAGGITLMGLSGLVIFSGAEYGSGPVILGISNILTNGIGLMSAQETEFRKVNYFDWSEGWGKVLRYSRFPDGIPPTIRFEDLEPRKKN